MKDDVHYLNVYKAPPLRRAMSIVKKSAKLVYTFDLQEDDEETILSGTLVFPVDKNVKFSNYCITTIMMAIMIINIHKKTKFFEILICEVRKMG